MGIKTIKWFLYRVLNSIIYACKSRIKYNFLSDVGRYVCLRLLEIECGFPTTYNDKIEHYFKELDSEYNFFKDQLPTSYTFPMAKSIEELNQHYIGLMDGVMQGARRITSLQRGLDITAVYSMFIITRWYVQFYKSKRHGDFAMALCFWLKTLIGLWDIDWDEPRNTKFYKIYRVSRWDKFVRIFCEYFDYMYDLISWI